MNIRELLRESPHDMPMSHEFSSDWNISSGKRDVSSVVRQIEARNARPHRKVIPVDKVLATQDWLDYEQGGGDPVLPGYDDLPVVVFDGEWYHLIDGHHRTNDTRQRGKSHMEAFVFYLEEL